MLFPQEADHGFGIRKRLFSGVWGFEKKSTAASVLDSPVSDNEPCPASRIIRIEHLHISCFDGEVDVGSL